ncbi:DUF2780 domain-containing protein [Vibrio sp. 404]|uniref:DUF2780 domain-containing protein n=1 Tax=Vibrio marinisediminis TaxID=2758441 RepID=A0A7W2IU33_9VIBR|nr:DUF2780 domain-containing protein [Vibrio marinisediminis]MBA5762682.1 DUF2780 domain-containing protein [Vibrio marinisediminis]
MKRSAASLAILLFAANANANFLDAVVDKDTQNSLLKSATEEAGIADHSLPMTDLLTNQLSVSPEQALSGSSALFSLAQNQLSSGDLSELESLIPWSSSIPGAQNLLGGVESMQAVESAFKAAGIDPSMISQFVPVILGYLGDSGASEGLLGSLGNLWKTNE